MVIKTYQITLRRFTYKFITIHYLLPSSWKDNYAKFLKLITIYYINIFLINMHITMVKTFGNIFFLRRISICMQIMFNNIHLNSQFYNAILKNNKNIFICKISVNYNVCSKNNKSWINKFVNFITNHKIFIFNNIKYVQTSKTTPTIIFDIRL